jgi:hypothetical protein
MRFIQHSRESRRKCRGNHGFFENGFGINVFIVLVDQRKMFSK